MGNLMLVGLFLIIILVAGEIANYTVYGPVLSDDEVHKYIDKWNSDFEKNPYDEGILSPTYHSDAGISSLFGRRFISTVGMPRLTSQYYIEGVGRVFRFSKGHDRIEELYKNAKTSNTKHNLNL